MSIFGNVFETERLTAQNGHDDLYSVSIPRTDSKLTRRLLLGVGAALVASVAGLVLAITALGLSASHPTVPIAAPAAPRFVPTRRIAFGSCTSYDVRPQPIWTDGIIPAAPDAWVWVGDMAYLDTSPVLCDADAGTAALPICNCSNGWLSYKGQCQAGNTDAARERWVHAVHHPDYRAFLNWMCPPSLPASAAPPSGTGVAAAGRFPPTGTDPAVCPRPIFGVYDDHDFGWNNGNKRLPKKADYKRLFLDAVGEAQGSTRRRADAGLQAAYTLSGGAPGRDIDLLLLDERWYRDPLPCSVRRAWCERVLAKGSAHVSYGWCRDFLVDDGTTGRGSCCTKDDDLATWCGLPSSQSSPLWRSACDPTSASWATVQAVLGPDNASLLAVDDALWDPPGVSSLWPRLLQAQDSPSCEVLGSAQREWLRAQMAGSRAALTIVASGSVPLGSLGYVNPDSEICSGDDWMCYGAAQLNLLHTLGNVSSGCVVVLTGDFHYGDIKMVAPGGGLGAPYSSMLQADKLRKHVYQVMSSGMTDSTAMHSDAPCAGTYREDTVGLRPLGPCSYMKDPNFGMVEVDWEAQVVHLTIRDANGGSVATGMDGRPQHVAFNLRTCAPLPV